MLNSKQRAYLKSLANGIDTILIIGKGDMSDEIIKQADDAINKRELIKGKVLESSNLTAAQAAQDIADKINAQVVQTIGSKFVLYKANKKEPKIVLPR